MADYIEQRKAEIRDEMERKHGVTRYSLIDDQLKKKKALDVVFELAQKEVLSEKEQDLLKRMSAVIRTADVNKADEILIKMLGLFEAEKVDVTTDGEELKNVFIINGKEVKF
jgi:transcriptional regulator CtsR